MAVPGRGGNVTPDLTNPAGLAACKPLRKYQPLLLSSCGAWEGSDPLACHLPRPSRPSPVLSCPPQTPDFWGPSQAPPQEPTPAWMLGEWGEAGLWWEDSRLSECHGGGRGAGDEGMGGINPESRVWCSLHHKLPSEPRR